MFFNKRLWLTILFVVALAVALVPAAPAHAAGTYFTIIGLADSGGCGAGSFPAISFTYEVAAGVTSEHIWELWGPSGLLDRVIVGPLPGPDGPWTYSFISINTVPTGLPAKTVLKQVVIATQNGVPLTRSEISFYCDDGVVGPGPSIPAKAVHSLILQDTPLYNQYDSGGQVVGQLKAGQDFFIVGSKTDAKGALWYALFVGGPLPGWVPAAFVQPLGEVPSTGTFGPY